jgi:hypothetical protein
MGNYIDHRPKLSARQLKRRLAQAADAERRAADAAIMEQLLREKRLRKVAADLAAEAERAQRRKSRPPKPKPLSSQELAVLKLRECCTIAVEQSAVITCQKLKKARDSIRNDGPKDACIREYHWIVHNIFEARHDGTWHDLPTIWARFEIWAKRVPKEMIHRIRQETQRATRMRARQLISDLLPIEQKMLWIIVKDFRRKAREARHDNQAKETRK